MPRDSQNGVNLDQEDRGSVEAWWVTIYHLGVWQMNLGSTDARSTVTRWNLVEERISGYLFIQEKLFQIQIGTILGLKDSVPRGNTPSVNYNLTKFNKTNRFNQYTAIFMAIFYLKLYPSQTKLLNWTLYVIIVIFPYSECLKSYFQIFIRESENFREVTNPILMLDVLYKNYEISGPYR